MPKSRCAGGSRVTSRPPISMLPASCASRPAITRSSVVLPQPEGPRKQTSLPLSTSSETASSAVKAPKRLVTPSTRRWMGRAAAAGRSDDVPAIPLAGRGRGWG